MAIDPPYRLDPFRNIINVHWEEEEQTWQQEGGPYDFTVLWYCEYTSEDSGGMKVYSAWLRAFVYPTPPNAYLEFQQQMQSLSNWATYGEANASGKSANILLRDGGEINFLFDLSSIYPQYQEYVVGGVTYRYKWDFGTSDPYKFGESLSSHTGQLSIAVPSRRTIERAI